MGVRAVLRIRRNRSSRFQYRTLALQLFFSIAFSLNSLSVSQNLAATFVNAFLNVGFGTDKLMLDENSKCAAPQPPLAHPGRAGNSGRTWGCLRTRLASLVGWVDELWRGGGLGRLDEKVEARVRSG
eukprot:2300752-Pleurochrysis_carterae.AAC.1